MDFHQRIKLMVGKLADGKHTVFAKKCGIPPSTMQTYITGTSIPKADHLAKIVSAYRINLNWLLVGEGEPFIQKGGGAETSEAGKVVAIDAAGQLLSEAEEETGISLNPAQRQALMPLLRKALAEDRRSVNEWIRSTYGEKEDEG